MQKISGICRIGSKPLIEEQILIWQNYNQEKEEELNKLKLEIIEHFGEDRTNDEINRMHVYGENMRKKDWTNKLTKIDMDKHSVFNRKSVSEDLEERKRRMIQIKTLFINSTK